MPQRSVARRWARAAPPPASCTSMSSATCPTALSITTVCRIFWSGLRPPLPLCPMAPRPGAAPTQVSTAVQPAGAPTRILRSWGPSAARGTGDNTSGGSDSGITGSDGGGLGRGAGGRRKRGRRRRQRLSRLGDQVVADARPVSSNGCADRRRRYPRGSCSPRRAAADMSFAAVGVWRSCCGRPESSVAETSKWRWTPDGSGALLWTCCCRAPDLDPLHQRLCRRSARRSSCPCR